MNTTQTSKTIPMKTNAQPAQQDAKRPPLPTAPPLVNGDAKDLPVLTHGTDETNSPQSDKWHDDPCNAAASVGMGTTTDDAQDGFSIEPCPAETLQQAVRDLINQAGATTYCRPALRALGSTLPADDAIVTAALNKAAEEINAKVFTNLYVAVLYAERRIRVEVLEVGAALLSTSISMVTALRLDGDVAKSLAVAVRSGRMTHGCAAEALLAGWLDYERRGESAPPEFLALSRKVCRRAVRMNTSAIYFLGMAAPTSGDPVLTKILKLKPRECLKAREMAAEFVRNCVTRPMWDVSIPESPVAEITSSGGAAEMRSTPKAARNAPCPCGSGKKFKHCCGGKNNTNDQYAGGGVTITDATSHPESDLTEQRICRMRYHELQGLDSKLLPHDLAEKVALHLARFHEFSRAIEVLQEIGRESVSEDTINNIAFEFFEAKNDEALRWIIHWAPGTVEVSFEMKVQLADPEERLQLLNEKAFAALEAEQSGETSSAQALYAELGSAALKTNHALGIVVARGVLPVCAPVNQTLQIHGIEDARDILGLDDNEPGRVIVNATCHTREIENLRAEMSTKVANRDAENRRLKTEILLLQETLKEREAIETAKVTRKGNATAPAASEAAEIRELRDKNRRLKGNLKAEHEEHNRTKHELEAARDELRRANEILESQEPEQSADHEQDDEDTTPTDVEPGWQTLRKPEYGANFLRSVRLCPDTAYTLAGRLAAGNPSSWKNVCEIETRHGTFRAKAGKYRLIFEIRPGDILHCVDFILRRDFDTWLKTAH